MKKRARRRDEADEMPLPHIEQPRELADYESKPLSRAEYISAMVHLYRGELGRAEDWRMRLDNTTNWAVLTTAALLTMSFGGKEPSHWILLIGLPLISVFLGFEARRFRFEDVWRTRVRKIEENFYGPILRRDPVSPDEDWGDRVAEDLLHPVFKISYRAAVRARFTRNYWVLYVVLVGGWCLKVLVEPTVVHDLEGLKSNLSTGLVPWQLPLFIVALVIVLMVVTATVFPRAPLNEDSWWTQAEEHVREVSDFDR